MTFLLKPPEIPAVSESESEGKEGDEEYEKLPRKQLFKTLDECGSGIQRKKEELVAELQTKTYCGVQKDRDEEPRLRKRKLKVLNFS